MGKGDVKTKKGKRFRGSYGITRPKKQSSGYSAPSKAESIADEPKTKAPAKKATAKKPATKKATASAEKKTTAKKTTTKKAAAKKKD
jgi:ribosomal small subunit protein bTHX